MPGLEQSDGTGAPEDWVPVEQRWLGLDRRTLRPAAVVLGVAAVMVFGVPAVDQAVSAGRAVAPGEILALAGDVGFVPAQGWEVVDGVALGDPTRSGEYPSSAAVVVDAVSLQVRTADYDGTAQELLTQIETLGEQGGWVDDVVGDRRPVRTTTGEEGVMVVTQTPTTTGLIVAFVIDGTGVEIDVSGPRDAGTDRADDVSAMIESVEPLGQDR